MEENSPCKKITFSQPEGSRKKGRPKLRWLDSVLKYVKLLKVETWWKKARDRNIWGEDHQGGQGSYRTVEPAEETPLKFQRVMDIFHSQLDQKL
jgi:hypothetical protein